MTTWLPPTLTDWLDAVDEDVAWIIPGFVPHDGIVLVSGPRKLANKTYMAFVLSLLVASAGNLGPLRSLTKGKVLFVEEEGARAQTKSRWLATLRGMGLPPDTFDNIYFAHRSLVKLNRKIWRDRLMAAIKELEPVMVVFDALVYMVDGNENDTETLADAISTIQAIRAMGPTVMVLAHLNNNKGYDPDSDIDSQVRGAGPLKDVYDVHLALRRYHSKDRLIDLTVRHRDAEETQHLVNWEFEQGDNGLTSAARLIIRDKPDPSDGVLDVEAYARLLMPGVMYDAKGLKGLWGVNGTAAKELRTQMLEDGILAQVGTKYQLNRYEEANQ